MSMKTWQVPLNHPHTATISFTRAALAYTVSERVAQSSLAQHENFESNINILLDQYVTKQPGESKVNTSKQKLHGPMANGRNPKC